MAIVRLANRLVQRLELEVVEPPTMKRTRRDRSRVPAVDELGQEVVCFLPVDQPGEGAVLSFQEHAREDQNVDQEARLAFGEAELPDRRDSPWPDALADFRPDGSQDHRKSSAKPGSNPRPPLRPL